jgi:Amt family ammonium transporter
LVVGLLAGVGCAYAVGLKFRFGFDDSLDVVGVHLVGGLIGTLAIGFLATAAAPAAVDGLFYGGGLDQLKAQAIGAFSVLAYSFIVTWIIGKALHAIMGFRIDSDAEISGIDLDEHAETGYDLTPASAGRMGAGAFAEAGVSSSTSEVVTEGARS